MLSWLEINPQAVIMVKGVMPLGSFCAAEDVLAVLAAHRHRKAAGGIFVVL